MAMTEGVKYDDGKLRWSLLPWDCVREIVKVLMIGAGKYSDDNWMKVPDAKNRYFSALHRHLYEWWAGETYDPESGLHHLSHAGCCLLFLLWFELERERNGS